MAETVGPKLGASLPDGYAAGDPFPEMDRFLRKDQTLIQCNAISYTVTAPPGGPANGDTYLVPAGATGAWTGMDENIAYWTTADLSNPGGAWEFYVPSRGWLAFNQADGYFYYFNGTIWVVLPGQVGAGSFLTGAAYLLTNSGSPYVNQAVGDGVSNGQWGVAGGAGANVVKFWTVEIPVLRVINKLTYNHLSNLVGSVSGLGLYDNTGAKIFSWDNINTGSASAGLKTTTLGSSALIIPGVYKWACSCSGSGTSPTTLGGIGTYGTNENVAPWNLNAVRSGVAANPMAAGLMPATLGALSLSVNIGVSLPMVCAEP